jgi:hypothetical protein
MRANYEIVGSTDDRLTIKDLGPWNRYATITNAAETVVEDLLPILANRRLFYYDSENELTEILVVNNKFAGFRMPESH